MKKAVMISIRPKWVELIAAKKKTVEVRKTRPKIETPFKCYIYETKGKIELQRGEECVYIYQEGRCAVIGEFVCDAIYEIKNVGNAFKVGKTEAETNIVARASCIDFTDMHDYLGHKGGYGWHISDLLIYDEPLWLSQMTAEKRGRGFYIRGPITRPPQSWCYVEEVKD